MKLKNTKYTKINGNIIAIEIYEDYSIKLKSIDNGITEYILHGSESEIKLE